MPASTDTRAVTAAGSTDSRYAASCCSNHSRLGAETTRAWMPVGRELLARGHGELHLGARGDEDDVGRARRRLGEHVRALREARGGSERVAGCLAVAALEHRDVLAGERDADGAVVALRGSRARPTATSLASAGRTTVKPGMARRVASCSIGWWVGPSSPRATESCVQTKIEGTFMSAASRTAGRM